MIEILKEKAYNYIQDLKISKLDKKKYYNKYVEYISIAYKLLLSINNDQNLLNRNLILYDKIFKNKLLELINCSEKPDEYIQFINSNHLKFKPYMLKDDDIKVLKEVIKPNFNYVDYCLSLNGMDYTSFYYKVRHIAIIIGYEDNINEKSSNYNYTDYDIPDNILDAIKNIE